MTGLGSEVHHGSACWADYTRHRHQVGLHGERDLHALVGHASQVHFDLFAKDIDPRDALWGNGDDLLQLSKQDHCPAATAKI